MNKSCSIVVGYIFKWQVWEEKCEEEERHKNYKETTLWKITLSSNRRSQNYSIQNWNPDVGAANKVIFEFVFELSIPLGRQYSKPKQSSNNEQKADVLGDLADHLETLATLAPILPLNSSRERNIKRIENDQSQESLF